MNRTTAEKGIAAEVRKMIKLRAYSFFLSTGVPVDELEDEGMVIYSLCLLNYKEDSGADFKTYLFTALNNGLQTFCRIWKRQIPEFTYFADITWKNELPTMTWYDVEPAKTFIDEDGEVSKPEISVTDNVEELLMYREMLSRLSPQAQAIAMILEESADEMLKYVGKDVKDPHAPKHLKGALKRFLKELGWRDESIRRAFQELSAFCSS